MNKNVLTAVLAAILMAVPAQAAVYVLDLTGASAEVAAWSDSTLINGLNLSFDNHGISQSLDSASVDSYGIWGSTAGDLIIKFPVAIFGLKFDFTIGDVLPGQLVSAVTAQFISGDLATGNPVDFSTADGTWVGTEGPGNSVGTFQWNSYVAADYAVLTFAPYVFNLTTEDPPVYTVNNFTVSNLAYGDAQGDLPEPSTWLMMLGGVALVGLGRTRRHKACI